MVAARPDMLPFDVLEAVASHWRDLAEGWSTGGWQWVLVHPARFTPVIGFCLTVCLWRKGSRYIGLMADRDLLGTALVDLSFPTDQSHARRGYRTGLATQI